MPELQAAALLAMPQCNTRPQPVLGTRFQVIHSHGHGQEASLPLTMNLQETYQGLLPETGLGEGTRILANIY